MNVDSIKISVCIVLQVIALYACPEQNKLLKIVMRLPWHYSIRRLHNLCNVEYIFNHIHFITAKFQARCNISSSTAAAHKLEPLCF